MFFADRIRAISPGDRVLEVGPGNAPHPRADVLLERRFDPREALEQRGRTPDLVTDKTLVHYEGGRFPFADGEFDYVICSHVVEHVEDVEGFCAELFRVARRGYLEFPTLHYEYLYNFPVHLQLLRFEAGELRYLPKASSGLPAFAPVCAVFHRSLELGHADLVDGLRDVMFQGFEWHQPFVVRRASGLDELAAPVAEVPAPPAATRLVRRGLRWIEARLPRSAR